MRQAISYYVNRSAAIKTSLQGAFPELTTPLQQGILGYSASVPQYSFDPAKGNAALTADGWKKAGGVWTKGGKQLTAGAERAVHGPGVPADPPGRAVPAEQPGRQGQHRDQPGHAVGEPQRLRRQMSLTVLEFANSDPAQMLQWYVPGQYFQNWTKVNNPALSKLLNDGQTATSRAPGRSTTWPPRRSSCTQAYEIPFHVERGPADLRQHVSGIEYEGGGDDFFYQAH